MASGAVVRNIGTAARYTPEEIQHEIDMLKRRRFFGCCTNGCKTNQPKCEHCVQIAHIEGMLSDLIIVVGLYEYGLTLWDAKEQGFKKQIARLTTERDKWLDLFNRSEQFQNGPTKRSDALATALKAIVIAWDADQDIEFDEALTNARSLMGFTLAVSPEADRG